MVKCIKKKFDGGMKMAYCIDCKREVTQKKDFSIGAFLFWCIISVGFFGVLYILYYIFMKAPSCPICNARLGLTNRVINQASK